jgi:glycosyltransferase involved in cell wall biosynthesis
MSPVPIVRVVPLQPHCFAFGGFELQMIAAMDSARAAGANIEPLDFWKREADFNTLHLWGFNLQHDYTLQWARAAGKKTVLSVLVNAPEWKAWLRHRASLAVGPARLLQSMLKAVDCITVVNEEQARYFVNMMRLPPQKVMVVPNVVDDIFFEPNSGIAVESIGIENYVICTGNVCSRKNQLALIAACRKLGVPLLLVGKVLTGEERYGQAVAEAIAAEKSLCWIQGLDPGSTELAEAYRGAVAFALLSFIEQQPISALEAAACRKPLVLADRPYAKQKFYMHAALADPHSVDSIVGALRRALDQPGVHCPPPSVVEQCRRERVGAAYMAIYEKIIRSGT